MKQLILLLFTALTTTLFAQNFKEYPPSLPFEGLFSSSIAFSDVNGDGTSDVLISGATSTIFTGDHCLNNSTTKLYLNDGTGTYTEAEDILFEDVSLGSIAFSDVTGDGFDDVLITGYSNSSFPTTKLYLNDGNGNFSEVEGTPFDNVFYSSVAFSDINGDGTSDVLITGKNNAGEKTTKLYTNDGTGDFSEMADTPFEGVWRGSLAFSDVNGDGTSDVLITGENNAGEKIAKLYINNGTGDFYELPNTPFEGVFSSSIAFSDVNEDATPDILISGKNNAGDLIAKLYVNDGTGDFSEMMDTPFEGVWRGSLAFSDIDEDGTYDVIITGSKGGFFETPSTRLYTNNGEGDFSESTETSFSDIILSSIAFSDVNGDGSEDILMIGAAYSGFVILHPIAKLFINDGEGDFSEFPGSPFDPVDESSIAFSDVNGDGTSDLLITGKNNNEFSTAKLYTNDGNGNFSELMNTPFEKVSYGSVTFSDVNGDESEDVLITGFDSIYTSIAKLYLNNGSGGFLEIMDAPFIGVAGSSVAFSDIDGNGSSDVLITGLSDINSNPVAKLYINDGTGNFSELIDTPFEGISYGSVAFSDVTGNDFPDVLITGSDSTNTPIAKLYFNNGDGSFSETMDTPFLGVSYGSVAFSDVTGNGFPDVLITGYNNSSFPTTKLYLNNGNGNFSEAEDASFEDVSLGSIAFSDVTGDGFDDVLITGYNNSSFPTTKLYFNNGEGDFSEFMDTPFLGATGSSIAFSDVNDDGKSDVVITGRLCSSALIAKLYINEGMINSTPKWKERKAPIASVHPNPNSTGIVFIEYVSTVNSILPISLFDVSGKLIQQFTREVFEGLNTIHFKTLTLPKGLYFLRVDDENRISTLKLIVQ